MTPPPWLECLKGSVATFEQAESKTKPLPTQSLMNHPRRKLRMRVHGCARAHTHTHILAPPSFCSPMKAFHGKFTNRTSTCAGASTCARAHTLMHMRMHTLPPVPSTPNVPHSNFCTPTIAATAGLHPAVALTTAATTSLATLPSHKLCPSDRLTKTMGQAIEELLWPSDNAGGCVQGRKLRHALQHTTEWLRCMHRRQGKKNMCTQGMRIKLQRKYVWQ